VAHHAAGTPYCEWRSTVGNGLPSGRKVALGGGDRVRRDEVGRRRRVLGVCTGVLAHSHVCVRAQVKHIGQGSAPGSLCACVWWFGQEDRDLARRWCARACVRQRRIAAEATPQVARDGSTASAS
jgi:hypothetical protein